ncbi:hypothetical protein F0562_002919 [Nyssa sinensis]|uniref:RING-type domain-containing protein n=1 Tax=Nyssa sinensis TaxID=561372 RepID=A0A5J5BXI1_9ASTE|nr:hypothetical protein F0562_002919 [Nyssa sinensis]
MAAEFYYRCDLFATYKDLETINNSGLDVEIVMRQRFQKGHRNINGDITVIDDRYDPDRRVLISVPFHVLVTPMFGELYLWNQLSKLIDDPAQRTYVSRRLASFTMDDVVYGNWITYGTGVALVADFEVTTIELVDEEALIDQIQSLSLESSAADCGRKGASKSVIEGLKKEMVKSGDVEGTCVVCLEELSVGSEFTRMACSHPFHHACLVQWLEGSTSFALPGIKPVFLSSRHRIERVCERASKELSVTKTAQRTNMILACLVCHSVESPSHSFRSCSVSSSDTEGRCSAIADCLTMKASLTHRTANTSIASSSKVTPQPIIQSNGVTGTPRLVRSRAVRRDLVRDWNFDEIVMGHLPRSLNYGLLDNYWALESDTRLGSEADNEIRLTHLSKKLEHPPYPENPLIKQYSEEYWIIGDLMTPEELRTGSFVRRVFNADEADVVFLPFFATLSAEMQLGVAKGAFRKKVGNEDYERHREVVDFV